MAFKSAIVNAKKEYEKKKKEEEELKNKLVYKTADSVVPIAPRNKDADNVTFTGTLLGGISNFTGAGSFADKIITDFKNDPTLMAKAKEQGLDTSQLYTTQENLNMFGSDVKRIVESGGAGISRTLSDLGKGTLIAARNMGALSSVTDKAINDLRTGTENAQIEELKSKAKEKGIDTVTLDEYLNKAKNTKTSLELINDFSANTFDKWSNEANQRIVELQNETDNDFTKAVIGFVPNLSQQAVTIGASLINPVLGTSVATGQAMGSYYNDAKSRGMTDEQANDFSQIMGIVEGATEMIGVDKLIKAGKGAKALAKGGLSSARKELSKEVITSTFGNLLGGAMDNFMQEAITEPIQEGVADWIGGKGNWENIDQRMLEAGINGAITSLITGGANIGVQSAVGTTSKIKNGQQLTQEQINQDLVDTLAEIEKFSPEEKQEFVDKYVTPGIKTAQEVAKQGLNQTQNEQNQGTPTQTSENAQQQVQEQEQQVTQQENENALKENVEPQNQEQEQEIAQEEEKVQKKLTNEENEIKTQEKKTISNKSGYNTPAKDGTIRLYTNTKAENINSILKDGLLIDKAKEKEYDGKMTWFETTPDLKGYGGTTIAVDVPKNLNMEKLNNTQYGVYDNISPDNIVFIDKPAFNNYRTSDIQELVDKFGKDKVLEVFDKSNNKSITREELENIINSSTQENLTSENKNENVQEKVTFNDIDANTPQEFMQKRKEYVQNNLQMEDIKSKAKDVHVIRAKVDDKIVGTLRYRIEDGKTKVTFIQVDDEYRRLGIGKELYKNLQESVGDNDIYFGELTEEGKKLLDNIAKTKEYTNKDGFKEYYGRIEDNTPRQVAPSEAPAQVPQVNEVKQRQVEPIRDITDVERPQVPQNQKTRKTYESIINSNQMTQEAKQIAKELMGYDTYVPQTNEFTLAVADRNIKQNGVDESLTSLTTKINNNERVNAVDIATGERLIEYYSKIGDREKLQEAIQTTAMAGTEAGRAVQAMSMINHQTPIGQVTWIQRSVDKVNKRLAKEGKKAQFNFTPEMQQKILNSTSENLQQNLTEVYKELGKQVPKSNMEKFNEWRYFSMLANPKTHFRNILGNLVMAQVQRAKNKVAGTIEDFVIGDNAERWNSLKGASKGMYEFARNDLKNADVQSMLGLNENKYNPQSRLQQNQRTFKSNLLEKTLGKLFELNSKALEVEDGWGLKSGYAKAMANYLNANNLDYNNLTDAQLQKARNYAVQQAKEATFHQDNTVANMLQTLENKNLFSKIALGGAIPFKKTPMNVALTGFEYSPAGFLKTLTTDLANLRKGKISANQFIDNISKNLTGTGITLVGYALTQAGILKASGSGDEDKDEFEEATGKQNYSIQIGDNTYSLDWLTPAGIPLFIGSELYQVSHQQEDGNKTKNENEAFKSITKILDATASAMNPMSEMTMISGLTNALKSYAQGSTKSIESMLANVGKSYVTQTVPTALGQIARSTDQYERSTTSTETDPMAKAIDSAKNQIISKIPGLRETLPISTDVWGNERETQDYVSNAILPWTSKEISKDPVNKALTDLYDATGESGVLPDNYIDKSLTIDKEKYKLTNEEYARLKQQYGKTAHDILSDLTKSKEYEQMSDEQKVKAVKEAYSYAKSTLKVTYSDENNLDAEESSTYKKVQSVIDNGGDAKEYFEYVGLIDGLDKDKDKIQALKNSNIKDKGAIYESTVGKNDATYQIMKNTRVDDKAYLDYKLQDFTGNKDENGKTTYSKQDKFYDYMDNANMTYEQKLLLTGMNYKLLPGERDTLANYIDTLPISASEKTDIYKKLKGATVYQNGEIYY